MIDNGRYGLRAKAPLSNPFMAILVTAHRVFAVVEMNRLQARKAKHAVKFADQPNSDIAPFRTGFRSTTQLTFSLLKTVNSPAR